MEKGLNIKVKKTEVSYTRRCEMKVDVSDKWKGRQDRVENLKYLRVVISEKDLYGEQVRHGVGAAWVKMSEISGIVFNREMISEFLLFEILMYGRET